FHISIGVPGSKRRSRRYASARSQSRSDRSSFMLVDSTQPIQQVPTDFMQHPYEFLDRVRADGPAHNLVFPHGAKVWLVTRYADVRRLLSDPRVSKDGRRANELFARHSGMIL